MCTSSRSTIAPSSWAPRSRPCSTTCVEGALLVTLVLFVFLLDLRAALIVAVAHPALAPDVVHLSARAGDERQPPLDGRGRLRHHRRRRGGDRRGHPGPTRAVAPDRSHRSASHPGRDRSRGAADGLRAADHHRRLPADLPAPAGRGPDLRADGEHGGRRARRVPCSSRSRWCRCWRRSPTADRSTTANRPCSRVAARAYDATLRFCLARPWRVLGRGGVLLAAAAFTLPRLGTEFLPELNEGALYVTFTLPSNVSLDRGSAARSAASPSSSPGSPRWRACCRSSAGPRTAPTRRSPTTSSSSSG